MTKSANAAFPAVGVVFLLLALLKFSQDKDWLVWAIIGVLFGGLGIFRRNQSQGGKS